MPSDIIHVPASDLPPLDRIKATEAAGRITLREVRDPDSDAFHQGYDMLASYFLPLGELEERSVLAGFIREEPIVCREGTEGTYHFVTAWEGDRLVGVRDCYSDIDHHTRVCLVSLAHAYVAPEHRRSGLAALLRALPITLARRTLARRVGEMWPALVVAEMEPAHPSDPETIVRLLAYGRSGFRVFDPQRMRYSQPEMREIPGAAYTGLPLLAVARAVGIDPVPPAVAELFPLLFHATHRMYLPAERVDPSEAHALAHLRSSEAPVPLLPLPTDTLTLHHLAPLVRSAVLPLYPGGLRGPSPAIGDPVRELSEILDRFAR